jgi:hypothetical protein
LKLLHEHEHCDRPIIIIITTTIQQHKQHWLHPYRHSQLITMFENFSFPSSTVDDSPATPPMTPVTRKPRTTLHTASEPLSPPLSPMHSPGPSPTDTECCYTYFDSKHDPLTSTLASFTLTPKTRPGYASPEASDNESEPDTCAFEDVRKKRQSMARMQTNEDLLRQLGELVKRVSTSSRKGSAGSLVESSGVVKRPNNSKVRSRSKPAKMPRDTKGSGRRVVA